MKREYDYNKEQKIWFEFYTNFNDDNPRRAEQTFEANGFYGASAEQLHKVNLEWFAEILSHGISYEKIIEIMPAAKEYGEEV